MDGKKPIKIAHVIYRLGVGGMENGLVNLINRMDHQRFQHEIICLDSSGEFETRISRDDVKIHELKKRPGNDISIYRKLWRLFREIHPDIVHTRNISAMEAILPAYIAGVKCRIHGEHGRDAADIYGTNKRYILLRKLIRPFVTIFSSVSLDIKNWLIGNIGIKPKKIRQIYNGVDIDKFIPKNSKRGSLSPAFTEENLIIVGTVGRLQHEKDQLTLVKAFLKTLEKVGAKKERLRLVIIGEGPLRLPIETILKENNAGQYVWMPGNQENVAELMQHFDLFVLPSLIEGISNTILEAMATGLPVLATAVGGNVELVEDGVTGSLVPASDVDAMSDRMTYYILNDRVRLIHGNAGRQRVEALFSIDKMIESYEDLYKQAVKKTIFGLLFGFFTRSY